MDYDVVIIGGGVAGCATAIALKQHKPDLSVAIVERNTIPRQRIGETLPPATVVLLQQLGIWERFIARGYLPAYGTCAAWGNSDIHYNEFLYSPYGHGWHLDRQAFDSWLVSEAQQQGAIFFHNTRISKHAFQQHWNLTLQNGAALQARFVVDASGRQANFARQQGAQKQVADQLVAIFRFFELATPVSDSNTLVEAQNNGWWYSALLPDGRLVVALQTDTDIARKARLRDAKQWSTWLQQSHYTRQRVEQVQNASQVRVIAAHSQCLNSATGPGWLAVGDATSSYDPLSSLGIFKALRSAIVASFAIADYLQQDTQALPKYQHFASTEYRAYLHKRREYYAEEQRFSNSIFWQRRQSQQSSLLAA